MTSNVEHGVRAGEPSLTSLLLNAYDAYPSNIAIRSLQGLELTYAEMKNEVRRVAGGLRNLGLKSGDRVAVVSRNRPEYMIIDHALMLSGLVRVPVNYKLHDREIVAIVKDCKASAIIMESERADGLPAAILETDSLFPLPLMISIGELSSHRGVTGYEDLQASEEFELLTDYEPENLCWLPYTSGTTGTPKGVMLSRRSLVACVRNLMIEIPNVHENDVVMHIAPLSHMSGYIALAYFSRGSTQIPVGAFDPEAAVAAIPNEGITAIPLVPTMLNMMLPYAESDIHDTGSLRTIVYAGSAISPDRLRRSIDAFGKIFVQCYGLSEIPFPLTALSQDDHGWAPGSPTPEHLASAGRVNPFVELRITDSDDEVVKDGELGEIQARGDTLMSGYFGRPSETQEAIADGGWLRTGDVGFKREGYVYIVDRKKDMIVSGGFNIFPSEVENAISLLDGVDEVAVVGVPHGRWGESVHACVVRRVGFSVSEEDILTVCKNEIADYKRPRSIEFFDSLPKTGSGKLLRRKLRDQYWVGGERRVGG